MTGATRRELRQWGKAAVFLSPWLAGFLLWTLLPVGMSLYYSFCDYSMLHKPLWIGLGNYRQLIWGQNAIGNWGDPVFWQSLGNTLYYAAMALPAATVVSLGLAMLLNAKVGGQSVYRTIIFLPTLVPAVASAMLWLWLFNSKLGLINTAILKLTTWAGHPWAGPGWLTQANWAMPALALMSLWGVGGTVVIYLAGLQDVPVELYEAAEIDGAGAWSRLWHVTLPTLSPVIFFNLVMAIIGTLQVFAVPYMMTGGGPMRSTYFYTMYLYDNAFTYLRMGYASAMAWVLLVLIVALTGLAFWSSRHWVHYQGK
jgi:multiple sugar transport system permease protein